jgi:hypothetical protein
MIRKPALSLVSTLFADPHPARNLGLGHCPLPALKAGAECCLAAVWHQPRLLSPLAPDFGPCGDLRLVCPAARASSASAPSPASYFGVAHPRESDNWRSCQRLVACSGHDKVHFLDGMAAKADLAR